MIKREDSSRLMQDSRTALHWACSAGHVDIAQFLLDLGVEVDLKDDVSQHCVMLQSRSLCCISVIVFRKKLSSQCCC